MNMRTHSPLEDDLLTDLDDATNTLILTFTRFDDEAPSAAQRLLSCPDPKDPQARATAPPERFIKLKSFARCLVIYPDAESAARVRHRHNRTVIDEDGNILYISFGPDTPLDQEIDYLHVPDLEKQWLISPPGSPVLGWVQEREDPPNTHHVDKELEKHLRTEESGHILMSFDAVSSLDPDAAQSSGDGAGDTASLPMPGLVRGPVYPASGDGGDTTSSAACKFALPSIIIQDMDTASPKRS
ncbi:hypothetical protein EV182_002064 [Spiromyces aspiralis]|uniref:Uncharacterized protein n=1 Tax=Spiromyces aspiralis TaxID=68401 RepID=A0ACC1HEL1_9FUNG|nr:hypothetical protein EV182_002064 [Spiromyces aspiralis]